LSDGFEGRLLSACGRSTHLNNKGDHRHTLLTTLFILRCFRRARILRGLHSSFGVFNVALLDAFGWNRGQRDIFGVLAVDALLSPAAGYLLDLYDKCHCRLSPHWSSDFSQQPDVGAGNFIILRPDSRYRPTLAVWCRIF
jgi:hypothetical protein